MRFVVVTGMSGAGKLTAQKMLEDMGYYCVDNLPVQLIVKFAELLYGGFLVQVPVLMIVMKALGMNNHRPHGNAVRQHFSVAIIDDAPLLKLGGRS